MKIVFYVLVALIVIILGLFGNFDLIKVTNDQMLPTYKRGTVLLTTKIFSAASLRRGTVVVYKQPDFDYADQMTNEITRETSFLGRIVGLPQEQMEILGDQIFINNQHLVENYLPFDSVSSNRPINTKATNLLIHANQYFILIDNRDSASDSRSWGTLPREKIQAVVIMCLKMCNQSRGATR